MEDPNKYEIVPVPKETVVGILKSKGPQSSEGVEILEQFTNETEAHYVQEGRVDAHSEALREKAHALNLAGFFVDAIEVMNEVAEIASTAGDTESYEEAQRIISKLVNKSVIQSATRTSDGVVEVPHEERITLEESGEKASREEVLNAFKKLTGKAGDPAELDSSDPEVIEANKLFERWSLQGERSAQGEDDSSRHNFEKTMLFVDAGFHDPEYLKDVLGWLFQDAENTPKDTDSPTRIQLRNDIANAMRKIRELLGSNQS